MKGIAFISPIIVALAACGTTATRGTTTPQTGSATPAAEVATPTPVPTPTPPTSYQVGSTVTTTTNAAYTVVAVARVHDTGDFPETPSASGGYFYGADVKICAGSEQELADPINWAVITADNTQYEGDAFLTQPSKGPALQSETVQPGACTAGWVYFDLPGSPAPTKVELESSDWYWIVGS
jgi:hypothetical protein